MEKYLEMTITQLKEETKKRGLKGTSAMKKQELAELLANADKMLAQKKEKKAEVSVAKTEKIATETPGRVHETTAHPVRTQGSQERPAVTRPQGSQERPMTRSQGTGERPATVRPQGSQERQGMVRPQGGQERPAMVRP